MVADTFRGKIQVMDYEELKRQIGKAGLTNKAFAELIGINPNSVTNFKRTKVPSNIAIIAVLIAEMKEHGIDFEMPITKNIKDNKHEAIN